MHLSPSLTTLLTLPADQKAIETLLRLAEEYGGHGKNLHAQGTDSAKGAHDQQPLKAAETDLKVCLHRLPCAQSAHAD